MHCTQRIVIPAPTRSIWGGVPPVSFEGFPSVMFRLPPPPTTEGYMPCKTEHYGFGVWMGPLQYAGIIDWKHHFAQPGLLISLFDLRTDAIRSFPIGVRIDRAPVPRLMGTKLLQQTAKRATKAPYSDLNTKPIANLRWGDRKIGVGPVQVYIAVKTKHKSMSQHRISKKWPMHVFYIQMMLVKL